MNRKILIGAAVGYVAAVAIHADRDNAKGDGVVGWWVNFKGDAMSPGEFEYIAAAIGAAVAWVIK